MIRFGSTHMSKYGHFQLLKPSNAKLKMVPTGSTQRSSLRDLNTQLWHHYCLAHWAGQGEFCCICVRAAVTLSTSGRVRRKLEHVERPSLYRLKSLSLQGFRGGETELLGGDRPVLAACGSSFCLDSCLERQCPLKQINVNQSRVWR